MNPTGRWILDDFFGVQPATAEHAAPAFSVGVAVPASLTGSAIATPVRAPRTGTRALRACRVAQMFELQLAVESALVGVLVTTLVLVVPSFAALA